MVDKTPAELDPGTPSDTSIVHASENGVSTNSKGHDERDISRLQGTAPTYSSSKTYNLNDLVTESGDVFRNITAIVIPEIFTPAKWSAVGMGESNTASNLGGGSGVFAQKDGVDLEFKSLVAGDNISITSDADEITITGEDITIDVRNISGSLIPKGSAVYITGSSGNNVTIDLALASGVATVPSIGIVLDDIANNSNGQVICIGTITTLDTSSFSVGDTLFVSATVAGDLTATPPTHPNLRQSMAFVLVSNVAIGEIQVITGDISGAESGTIFNTFAIGDNLAGTKILEFDNGFSQQIRATPTVNRIQDFQDLDGTIALVADITITGVANVGTGAGLIFRDIIAQTANLKSLIAGTNITITNNADDITIDATSGGAPSFFSQSQNTVTISSGTNYLMVVGGNSGEANEIDRQNVMPNACTLERLTVQVSSQRNGISVINLRINGVDGNQTIPVPTSTTGLFQDLVNTDSISNGDLLAYQVVRGGGSGSWTLISTAMEITS